MTLPARSCVGVAQIVFYVPAVLAAAYLVFRKHHRLRLAWGALATFSIVRVAGGIELVLFENHTESVSYIIAGLVLQGTGVVPLILSTVGLLRIIKHIDFPESRRFKRSLIGLRVFFALGIALLVTGSCLLGNYEISGDVSTGAKLARTGYIIIVFVLVGIAGFDAFFWPRRWQLTRASSLKILYATSASIPFLAVRLAYACLSIFSSEFDDPKWSPLFGSVPALVCMHSLMEYIVVVMYVVLGFQIPGMGKKRSRDHVTQESSDEDASR